MGKPDRCTFRAPTIVRSRQGRSPPTRQPNRNLGQKARSLIAARRYSTGRGLLDACPDPLPRMKATPNDQVHGVRSACDLQFAADTKEAQTQSTLETKPANGEPSLSEANPTTTDLKQELPNNLRQADLVGCNLRGAQLQGRDLSGLDLSYADLSGANLVGANLAGSKLFGASLCNAECLQADFSDADLSQCNALGAGFGKAILRRCLLFGADLAAATLTQASLEAADLRTATMKEARLLRADLTGADLARADLQAADLSHATVTDAQFVECDLRRARLLGVNGSQRANWIGADIRDADFCGAYLVRRTIGDQNYLHEFRNQDPYSNALYWVWWATSDCGRSITRWSAWIAVIVLVYSGAFNSVGVDWGSHPTWLSPMYLSVVTLTTLGYGDAVPMSVSAQIVAMTEVFVGYVMLGGLLSIFSNKMARRSD